MSIAYTSPPDAAPAEALNSASRLGRFALLERVGRGSAGEVWRAVDTVSGQTVAIKQLHAAARSSEGLELRSRFAEEGRIAGRLQHPDIVACIDHGEHEGRPWIAMEWLSGEDLSRLLSRLRRLDVETAVRIACRVALALDHAHRQGVVHRDLKPANIHVDLGADSVKLADFGVAREQDSSRTATGMFLGTPAYMAPEQLAGAAADARGDLYALGVVLFESLSGRRPHDAGSLGELLRRVSRENAPDVRTLNPAVPQAVALELARALDRDPARRHASAREFAQALSAATLAP